MSFRENIPDAMMIGGAFVLFLTFMSYVMKNQTDQIFAQGNMTPILFPTCIILIGFIFKFGFMTQENKSQFTQQDINQKNKKDSESILKKYESMEDLK